jgi:hypothetical protein
VDVLRKKGNSLELIEVKSSGFDSTLEGKDARDQVKKLEEKLYDLAFQTGLVERACSEYRVVPKLCAYCQLDTLSMVLIYQYLQSKKPEVFPY